MYTRGLEAYYTFDSDATDDYNSHDATLYGNPSIVTGHIDNAIDLDGTGDYLTSPYTHDGTSYTLSAWVNLDATGTECVFDFSDGAKVQVKSDASGTLNFYQSNGGTWNNFASASVSTGTWYHVAAVWTGSTCYGYVDGSSVGSASVAGMDNEGRVTHVGIEENSNGTKNAADAQIDDARIYSRALPSSEIADIANQNEPPYTVSGSTPDIDTTNVRAIASWNALEEGGAQAIDPSGMAYHDHVTDFRTYDNGIKGKLSHPMAHTSDVTMHFRAKTNGEVQVWFDRTVPMYNIIEDWSDPRADSDTFPETTLGREMYISDSTANSLLEYADIEGDWSFSYSDVEHYFPEYSATEASTISVTHPESAVDCTVTESPKAFYVTAACEEAASVTGSAQVEYQGSLFHYEGASNTVSTKTKDDTANVSDGTNTKIKAERSHTSDQWSNGNLLLIW